MLFELDATNAFNALFAMLVGDEIKSILSHIPPNPRVKSFLY